MSREIKFRAWDGEKYYYNIQDAYDGQNGLPEDSFGLFLGNENNYRTPTKKYIVEQYTGLKDRNGKEIYEGDILSGSNGSINGKPWEIHKRIVSFKNGNFNLPKWAFPPDRTHYIEVIGNIHENPELIER